ncbi:MAG: cobalamin B12-binding domain-containing protein, partial [Nitrospirae bacterium]|nr:cobalamin B12-binding domain-containing protein [Nitrospirota bacterium]
MIHKPILLIRPPMRFLPNRSIDMIDLPLGLLYIGASLEGHGYNVALIDGVMPDSDYKHLQDAENHFGITVDDMAKRIKAFDFDIACISAQYTVQFPNAVKMGELLKRIKPDCKVLIGGAHVTVQHREIISRHDCFDVAVRGEGEYSVIDGVEAIREKGDLSAIKGVTYRSGDEVISTEDREHIKELDSLPFPAYHLVDMEKFFRLNKKFASRTSYAFNGSERGVSLMTSRGCPHKCSFCSIHLHMGRRWRYHSPEYVLRHMEYLIKTCDVKYFHLEDDNLTANPKRFDKILDGIIERKYRIRWDTPNGVRADTLNLELLKKCRQTGCAFLIFGIESGVQRVLDEVINKGTEIADIEKAAELAQKAKVNTRGFYLIGNPGETREEIRATASHALKMMKKYDCSGGIGVVAPLYGTKAYEDSVKNGYLRKKMTPENIAEGYSISGMLKTKDFDPEFLRSVLEDFDKSISPLLKWIFIKRILINPMLLFYCIKAAFTLPPSRW